MDSTTLPALHFLTERLADRREAGLLRSLRTADGRSDFCSNDYLGFARSTTLFGAIQHAAERSERANGATGSRLLAGQTELANEVEAELARFYQTEAALLFNSGYDANLGLLACLPQRGDTLLTDELIHASMIDGARLSYATRQRFRHNDLSDLETQLRSATGNVFVAVESVYSMDGDVAPLPELTDLCARYGAHLLVDEAHATGVFGPNGEGLTVALGLQARVLARVHTFGKALGVHGAAVVGATTLREYLINFARPFIYSTALPPHSLHAIRCAHQLLPSQPALRAQLHERIAYFCSHARNVVANDAPAGRNNVVNTPIQLVPVPGNARAGAVAAQLQTAGFDVRAILSPTVPVGQERLRICLHAFNTEAEIDGLLSHLANALRSAT